MSLTDIFSAAPAQLSDHTVQGTSFAGGIASAFLQITRAPYVTARRTHPSGTRSPDWCVKHVASTLQNLCSRSYSYALEERISWSSSWSGSILSYAAVSKKLVYDAAHLFPVLLDWSFFKLRGSPNKEDGVQRMPEGEI